jgi:hypothetical protein
MKAVISTALPSFGPWDFARIAYAGFNSIIIEAIALQGEIHALPPAFVAAGFQRTTGELQL